MRASPLGLTGKLCFVLVQEYIFTVIILTRIIVQKNFYLPVIF